MTFLNAVECCWKVAGSQRVAECKETPGARCYVCAGDASFSMLRSKWLSDTYTNQNRAKMPHSDRVCQPCAWIHSSLAPVPGRLVQEGKTRGGSWRNYSHLGEMYINASNLPISNDFYPQNTTLFQNISLTKDDNLSIKLTTASKGEKNIIKEFLCKPKQGYWFAAIAETGQKHVVPFTPMNPPGTYGKVLFDEVEMETTKLFPELLSKIEKLLALGASKEAILTGEYSHLLWIAIPQELKTFEKEVGLKYRGNPLFTLVIWISQVDKEKLEQILKARKAKNGRTTKRRSEELHHLVTTGNQESLFSDRTECINTLGTNPNT